MEIMKIQMNLMNKKFLDLNTILLMQMKKRF